MVFLYLKQSIIDKNKDDRRWGIFGVGSKKPTSQCSAMTARSLGSDLVNPDEGRLQ
jgi:hypothetical protein